MDPASLIPASDAIPVAWGWFEVLSLLTFALHLLLMNTVLGGAVFALVGQVRGQVHGQSLDTSRDLSKRLPIVLALTVNLGVPPLLFVQVLYGNFLYTSSLLMAVFWLGLVGTVMTAYALLYVWDFHFDSFSGPARTLCLGASVALLLVSAFILVNNMSLMIRPEAWAAYFQNARGTLLNLSDPTLIPRYLHFVLAALAVGGLFVALSARLKARATGDLEAGAETVRQGLRWFTTATMAQMAVGLWWLMSLRREVMLTFMGDSVPATAVFLAALVLGLSALTAGMRGRVELTAWLTGATVLAMVGVRSFLRAASLAPYHSVSSLAVTGELSPLLVFLAALAVTLAVVVYLLKLYRQAGKEA